MSAKICIECGVELDEDWVDADLFDNSVCPECWEAIADEQEAE